MERGGAGGVQRPPRDGRHSRCGSRSCASSQPPSGRFSPDPYRRHRCQRTHRRPSRLCHAWNAALWREISPKYLWGGGRTHIRRAGSYCRCAAERGSRWRASTGPPAARAPRCCCFPSHQRINFCAARAILIASVRERLLAWHFEKLAHSLSGGLVPCGAWYLPRTRTRTRWW